MVTPAAGALAALLAVWLAEVAWAEDIGAALVAAA